MQNHNELELIKQLIAKFILDEFVLGDSGSFSSAEFIKLVELFLKIISLEHKLHLNNNEIQQPSASEDKKILEEYLEKFLRSQKTS